MVIRIKDPADKKIAICHNPRTKNIFRYFKWEILEQPAYTPDLARSDYHLFVKMKELEGRDVSQKTMI
ncbi:hypothetical protein HZH66_005928 [Vespula vulgaris]|uniref:Uncharacterized protein n=1 Tax=Vespula vulgaris TaxID=7454 RepID=A0A834NA92_VESVU|nr:hypothetical protein HZH66_005928 [Vespula vulgaris]